MRPTRRQFWLLAGGVIVLPAGCGDKRSESTPNPDLGPAPPAGQGPPKRKGAGAPEVKK
ncbi:MAG: hypothetical protein U0804_16525 [Gemmataceae bacterium]